MTKTSDLVHLSDRFSELQKRAPFEGKKKNMVNQQRLTLTLQLKTQLGLVARGEKLKNARHVE
jgi:hypothetical protein